MNLNFNNFPTIRQMGEPEFLREIEACLDRALERVRAALKAVPATVLKMGDRAQEAIQALGLPQPEAFLRSPLAHPDQGEEYQRRRTSSATWQLWCAWRATGRPCAPPQAACRGIGAGLLAGPAGAGLRPRRLCGGGAGARPPSGRALRRASGWR